jgi:hypothetical protein
MFFLQPGTTALRPSVPFQERGRASVSFKPTHIPQHQGSTPGTANGSGFSQRLRPSVPFQERDWTSVNIQPTQIPQHQLSTPGVATSSGLSQGRASWLWWQSRDEQREESLDAVMVETAEVMSES